MSALAGRRAAVGAGAGVALCGALLLALTPDLHGHPGLHTLWIALALVLLKLPVLGLLWWLFMRRRHDRAGRWDAAGTERFLAAVEDGVARAPGLPDASARLDALQADAWRAAREGDAAATPRAVEIALRIDRMRLRDAPGPARTRNSAN